MTPNALSTLVSIAELGAFAEVARRRNMTLSAVSMQMKTLERELGVSLFDRRFRPPQLTPLGRLAAERAREVLAAETRLRAAVSGPGRLRGEYRIGFVLTASVRVLPGFLTRSAEAAPNAAFLVETGLSEGLEARVLSGALDAAVVTLSQNEGPGLNRRPIAREEIVFALPRAAGEMELARAMEELAFLQFMPRTGIGVLIARQLEAEGLRPSRRIVLDGIEAIAECVRAGLGFTALPKPDIERYSRGEVVLRPMPRPLFRDMALVTRAGSATDAAAAALAAMFD